MRELKIINELIEADDYLSMDYFINKHSVSKRTLQNDFSYLSNIMNDKGFYLIQKRGKGYLLEIKDKNKFDKFINNLKKISNRPKATVENIIAYITLKNNYVTMESLIDFFGVSKSTLKGYRSEIDNYLSRYDLKMERRAHYGLKIEKSLIECRELLLDLYNKKNEVILEIISEEFQEKFIKVKDCLIENIKNRNLIINYTELNELVGWLNVTIFVHLQLKTPVDAFNEVELINIIGEQFGIGIGGNDIEELDKLIKCKSRNSNYNVEQIETLEAHISEFLEEMDKNNKTFFNDDNDFKNLLVTHVSALINRLSFKISYTNPIVDELAMKYPMIFTLAISLGEMLKEKYGVEPNKDEIGFIATYFVMHMEKEFIYKLKKYNRIAIVCSSGGGSAFFIKLKLEVLFRDAVIETFSILQMKEIENFNPGIIFSISELSTSLKVPIIYIKELLDDYDILNIKQLVMFEQFDEVFINNTKEYYLKRFLNSSFFSIDYDSKDYIECLNQMSKEIEVSGIGGENYSEYVLKRESFATTIYLNGVAIPHPIEMKSNKDLISIKILKNPIIYDGKKVSIIFMIALKKDNLGFHKGITNDLFTIMNNLEMIQGLLKVNTFKEFMALIK